MSTCIVAATELELQFLPTHQQYDVLITGIGAHATIYQLLKKIQQNKPSLIIQAGIAGSFDTSIPLTTPLIVQQDRFADLGVQEQDQWNDVFDMELQKPNIPPYTNGWLLNPHQHLLNASALQKVTSISINEVTTSAQRIQQFSKKYRPTIESMEGAAFHFVCLQENIPFIQLRTVSNYVGQRDKSRWQMKEALQNLATQLQSLVNLHA